MMSASPMRTNSRHTPNEQRLILLMVDTALDAIDRFGAANRDDLRANGFTWTEIAKYGGGALATASKRRPAVGFGQTVLA